VNNLPIVATQPRPDRQSNPRDLLIASPTSNPLRHHATQHYNLLHTLVYIGTRRKTDSLVWLCLNKSSAVAETGDRLATDMGREWGGAAVGAGSPLGSHLTQCGLGRRLPLYQVATWSIQPFGHNCRNATRLRVRIRLQTILSLAYSSKHLQNACTELLIDTN